MKTKIYFVSLIAVVSVFILTQNTYAAFQMYTYTNKVEATSTPKIACLINKTSVGPNQVVVFSPSVFRSNYAERFIWKGETTATSTGSIALSFIYPGKYTVVMRAVGYDGTVEEVKCPEVSVAYDAIEISTSTIKATYLFPFSATTTKGSIPREIIPYSDECFNLVQDLWIGLSDDVSNPGDGVIYKLQEFLYKEKYLSVKPTGYFGQLTKKAVQSFQRYHNIIDTGYVGPMTREEMKNRTCLG